MIVRCADASKGKCSKGEARHIVTDECRKCGGRGYVTEVLGDRECECVNGQVRRTVCFNHLPRPLWNQATCTHTPRASDRCPFCGAIVP